MIMTGDIYIEKGGMERSSCQFLPTEAMEAHGNESIPIQLITCSHMIRW